MATYILEFRIVSEEGDLDLEAITKHLGIIPTNTRLKGERRSEHSVFGASMWGYDANPDSSKDWDSLEEALEKLLEVLMPLKHKIDEYRERYKLLLSCGHFTSGFDDGPTLSPEILKKLGQLGVELSIATYCSLVK